MAMETYHGHVRTPADAIKLFEACRLGILPRVQRRLSEKERQSIKSGSVFVWDEREAGMRRWTDGKSWSASRVSGSFLTYREMEGKRGGGNFVPPPVRRHAGKTPDSGRGSDEDADMDGEGPDGYRYKPDGLMKQSFSITTSGGQHLHLISYYARPHAQAPDLPQPTTDPTLRGIVPAKGMYPESTVHEQSQGPVTTRAPMQSAYMASPQHMMAGPRPGPPAYYQPVTQGYAWPPSPAMTPPQFYDQYGRPVIFTTHSQPTSAHASPHPIHYSPQHPHVLPPTSGPIHQPTIFDRPPPPLQETALPPPPPQHRVAVTASVAPMAVPVYAPNLSSRVDQGRLVAEQQAQQAQQQQAQQQQAQQQQAQAQAQHAQMTQQAQSAQRIVQQSQMALDPRLATSSAPNSSTMAPMQSPGTANVQPRNTPPQTYSQPPSTTQTPISPAPASLRQENSQSIPSISNLVNGTLERSSPPPSTTLPPPTSTPGPTSTPQALSTPTIPNTLPQPVSANGREDARSEKSGGSRAGSKSPKAGSVKEEADGPKDFPPEKMGEKMGFGEDVRALRVLDRKFCI